MKRSIDAMEMGNKLPAVLGDTPNVDIDWTDFNKEIDSYDPTADQAATANKTDWWDTVNKGLQTASDLVSKYRTSPATSSPDPTAKSFNWTPIAIGGGALAVLYLLTRK